MVRLAPGAGQARVYDVSGHVSASLGASLGVGARATAAERRERRKAALASRDTDLLHDFAFPTVSTRVKLSPDSRYVFAAGSYPPQIHVYDTKELSLKFKRHLVSDIVDFQVLEDDWRKFAVLTADRYLDMHSQYGSHFRIRVPRPGRDLMLHRGTADLFVCGAGPDVWRLNLEQGRFLAPLVTSSTGGNNVCGICPRNQLLAFGGEDGIVEMWDPRALGPGARPAGSVRVGHALAEAASSTSVGGDAAILRAAAREESLEVTALRFDDFDGVSMAVGTSTGHTLLFDLRSPAPTLIRDQGYGDPIRSLKLHQDRVHCLSADAKSIKVWDRSSGANTVVVEPDADVNHLCVFGSSGVVCAAAEDSRVRSYYIPELGPAPDWCSFLDSFTEELEDATVLAGTRDASAPNTAASAEADEVQVYENYKFVARDELEGLGLGHLIGTDMLKAYMHGFFVHMRLYRRAVDAASPFAYETYRKEKAKERMEAERESRIGKTRRRSAVSSAKVNRSIAAQLSNKRAETVGRKGETAAVAAASILEDSRFSAMFDNADFKVDEGDERFQHLNPSGVSEKHGSTGGRADSAESSDSDAEYLEQFDPLDEDGEPLASGGNPKLVGGGRADLQRGAVNEDSDVGSSSSDASNDIGSGSNFGRAKLEGESMSISKTKRKKRIRRNPQMYEVTASAAVLGSSVNAYKNSKHRKDVVENVPLGSRIPSATGARPSLLKPVKKAIKKS